MSEPGYWTKEVAKELAREVEGRLGSEIEAAVSSERMRIAELVATYGERVKSLRIVRLGEAIGRGAKSADEVGE